MKKTLAPSPSLFFIILLVMASVYGLGVHMLFAETLTWSDSQPNLIAKGSSGPDRATQYLNNGFVTVNYGVQAQEIDASGNVIRNIMCGSTVAPGTRVKYSFIPHHYSDVHWVATGGFWDTPYGEWRSGATAPLLNERCTDKNLYYNSTAYNSYYQTDMTQWLFAALSVAPPVKVASVSGDSAICTPDGEGQVCIMTAPGTQTVTFNFAETYGYFYPGYYFTDATGRNRVTAKNLPGYGGAGYCSRTSQSYGQAVMKVNLGNSLSGKNAGVDYRMVVPQQQLACEINVTEDTNMPPSVPSVSTAQACYTNTSFSVSMLSSDPEGEQIRYEVDWGSDGSVNDYVPPLPDFVDGGFTRYAFRTFATAGERTVRVRAVDTNGYASAWSETLSFSCVEPPTPVLIDEPEEEAACVDISAERRIVRMGDTVRINWGVLCGYDETQCVIMQNGRNIMTPNGSTGSIDVTVNAQTTFSIQCPVENEHDEINIRALPRVQET